MPEYHNTEHERLRDKVMEAIAEFRESTRGVVTRLYYSHGALDLTTTLSPPGDSKDLPTKEIQRRLDFLDEAIDTLEREKRASGDHETDLVEQAKHVQQRAREYFSEGDRQAAWLGIIRQRTASASVKMNLPTIKR